jgi:cell division protein ZapE
MMLKSFEARVESGELKPDPAQRAVALRLQRLQDELLLPAAAPAAVGGFFARLARPKAPPAAVPRGVYIHGGVGRGKSMLMDLFFAEAPVAKKRRVHFHEFMLEVQKRLQALRQEGGRQDPLKQLAADIAAEGRLLCFDEFHVVDIADAMILGRLFTGLFEQGVVVVATSNWPPDRLYEDGLQRELFLPFIALLEDTLDVVAMDGPTDYRLARLHDVPVYVYPLGPVAEERLEGIFATLADGARGAPEEIAVGSRHLVVPRAAKGVAEFEFPELCARALGAADYLALTERYHTLLLRSVPRLTPDRRNEARRFMTLVDALYERRVVLIVAAEAGPDRLYASGDGAFEFQRTVSRLMEMQSRAYIDRCRARRPDELPKAFAPYALTSDLV